MTELLALFVAEPEATASELLPQDGFLSAEVVNDPLLLLVGVPGDYASEQMPRLQGEFHGGAVPVLVLTSASVRKPKPSIGRLEHQSTRRKYMTLCGLRAGAVFSPYAVGCRVAYDCQLVT